MVERLRNRHVVLLTTALLLSSSAGQVMAQQDPSLLGWWKLNEGQGTIAADSSGKGHNGTIVNPNGGLGTGGSVWVNDPQRGMVISFNGTDGSGACVTTGAIIPAMTLANSFTWAFWAKQPAAQATNNDTMLGNRYGGTSSPLQFTKFTPTRFEFYNNDGSYVNGINYNSIPSDVWIHHVLVKDGTSLTYYRNGVVMLTNTMTMTLDPNPFYMGADDYSGVVEAWEGYLSDVRLYTRVLTATEIKNIMLGLSNVALAVSPADGATDVPRDATLSWTAGQFPSIHDVYFGTVATDVNAASRTNAKGLLVSKGQADTTFTPANMFAYGQTYYWRIDEVNKSADGTINRGSVWSFTAEPYAYPITAVTATASSSQPGMGPENTINGSGMTGDCSSTDGTTMWLSAGTPPNWIQYQFDKVYKLYDLKVWNSNQLIETFLGFGAKDVKIEYSTDGTTWTALANVPQFARAPGLADCGPDTTVSLGGLMAKYVKLTISSTWGGMGTITGLAEVRFSYVPVQARTPQPATGATGVSVGTTLSWRPGREAGSHKVFFGTDPNAVANGTVAAKTVTAHAFDPGALLFGTTYYWKVDEVNTVTYPGDVWRFTTLEFAAVDDFESYNDDKNRIYDSWIDGLTDGKSGSTVGYMTAPFAEQMIVHGGKQSMPLAYDNSKAPFYSETTRDLGTAQDWTGNGATHMDLWFRGYPALTSVAVTSTGSALTLTGDGTDIWNNSDDFVYAYKTLSGDGTIVARVVSVGTGTNTWAKGGVMIRDSLDGGSTFVDMVLTANSDGAAGNGASFQYRLTTNGGCANTDAAAVIKPPYYVKIQRTGDSISGWVSANGTTWTQQGATQTIAMTAPVYVGICVTAHIAGEQRTMQFDNITTTGNVTGSWQGAQINAVQYNAPAGLYVVVQDGTGKSKLVANADPAAAATGAWTQWKILLSDLTAGGVKTTAVKKVTVGVGDKNSPKAGGTGMVYIDDIGFGHPVK